MSHFPNPCILGILTIMPWVHHCGLTQNSFSQVSVVHQFPLWLDPKPWELLSFSCHRSFACCCVVRTTLWRHFRLAAFTLRCMFKCSSCQRMFPFPDVPWFSDLSIQFLEALLLLLRSSVYDIRLVSVSSTGFTVWIFSSPWAGTRESICGIIQSGYVHFSWETAKQQHTQWLWCHW